MKFLFYFFSITLLCQVGIIAQGQDKIIYLDSYGRFADSAKATSYLFYTKDSNIYKVKKFLVENDELVYKGYSVQADTSSKTGKYIIYSEGHKSAEGIYENNKPSGEWTFYFSDDPAKIWYKLVYDTGRAKELTSYYKSGKEKRREFYDQTYHATGKSYDETGNEIPYTPFRSLPSVTYDLDSYLQQNLTYPEHARKKNIHGRVIVQFVVEIDGSISHVHILNGIGGGCDEEAARVISRMPKWKPGLQDNQPVNVLFTKPINFTLQ